MSMSIPQPTHREFQEMLGVFALDAVDPEAAAIVERHLGECPKCSTEVAQHYVVAGLLANSGGASPAKLWDGIASQLEGSTTPPWKSLSARLESGSDRTDYMKVSASTDFMDPVDNESPDGSNLIPIATGRWRRKWSTRTLGVVAAATVVAVVLGVHMEHRGHQVSTLQVPLSATEQSALNLQSAKQVQLRAPHGMPGEVTKKVTVILTKSGTGFVEAQGLSRLPANQTYQLWGVVGRKTISLGLLGACPNIVAFSAAGSAPVSAFAITAEQASGVVESDNQPVVAGQLDS